VAGEAGLVAVGWAASGGDVDAAVWTSTDGRSWDLVRTADTAFGGAGDQRMSSVTWLGETLVAGGSSTAGGGDPDGAVWLSADGTEWERAWVKAMTGAGRQRISSLVSFDADRLLAAGSRDLSGDEQAAAWIAKLRLSSQ
jgi:molecular chaperone DnaK